MLKRCRRERTEGVGIAVGVGARTLDGLWRERLVLIGLSSVLIRKWARPGLTRARECLGTGGIHLRRRLRLLLLWLLWLSLRQRRMSSTDGRAIVPRLSRTVSLCDTRGHLRSHGWTSMQCAKQPSLVVAHWLLRRFWLR